MLWIKNFCMTFLRKLWRLLSFATSRYWPYITSLFLICSNAQHVCVDGFCGLWLSGKMWIDRFHCCLLSALQNVSLTFVFFSSSVHELESVPNSKQTSRVVIVLQVLLGAWFSSGIACNSMLIVLLMLLQEAYVLLWLQRDCGVLIAGEVVVWLSILARGWLVPVAWLQCLWVPGEWVSS